MCELFSDIMLQNELESEVALFITHVQSHLREYYLLIG